MSADSRRRRWIVAIDGPAGAGKSTVSRLLANRLGYLHVDTGGLYRALAWKAAERRISPEDTAAVESLCRTTDIQVVPSGGEIRIWVDQTDVSDRIRTPEISTLTSRLSALESVRESLLGLQRSIGKPGGIVMEGRDIGTAVFPDADIKFYLEALPAERARRRFLELSQRGMNPDFSRIAREVEERDHRDRTRTASPLVRPPDAFVIDCTHLSAEEVVAAMEARITELRLVRGEGE